MPPRRKTPVLRRVARRSPAAGDATTISPAAVLDAVPVAMGYVDRGERLVLANPAWERLSGLSLEGRLGRPLREVFGADTYAALEPHMRRALAGEAADFERDLRRDDGTQLRIRVQYIPDRGPRGTVRGYYYAVTDITELKAAQRRHAEDEARFRALTDLGSDWFWETDAEHRFVAMHAPGEVRAGLAYDAVVGLRRWEIPGNAPADGDWRAHRADLDARRPFRDLLLRRLDPSGKAHFVSVSGVPMHDPGGTFVGYRGVASDATDRVTLELRNAALARAIESAGMQMVLCDPEDRVVMANRAFREGNAERIDWLRPGAPYVEYLREGLRRGRPREAVGREDAWLEARLAQRRRRGETFEQQLGEDLWVLATDHRLPDGSTLTAGIDITQQKRVQRALEESEARFRDFAASSGEWFWETDADGRFTWLSEDVQKFTGVPREWHYGKSRLETALAADADFTAPAWRAHLDALARHEPFRDFRYQRRAPDGLRWIRSSGVPRFGRDGAFLGYRGTGRDDTRQVELEAREALARERLRLAVENLNEPMCLTDPEGRFVFVNRRFRELNANIPDTLDPGESFEAHVRAGIAAGNNPEGAADPDGWVAERLRMRALGAGPYRRSWTGGTTMLIYDQVFADGSILTYGVDITDRLRAERALQDANTWLEARVRERTQELEAFSYSVSHDLRAPLRAINGHSGILLEDEAGRLSDDGRRRLAAIGRNAARMGELVDDLLELARINRMELKRQAIDVRALALAAVEDLQPEYPRARIELGRLPTAEGDPVLLKQVLDNLIGNALKYSSRRESPQIEVGWRDDESAYFVRDNGVGFDMAHAGKMFGTFERLHTPGEFEGTGIGLAIVKRVIDRHGGRVWAESRPGEGATFSFTLGVAEAAT